MLTLTTTWRRGIPDLNCLVEVGPPAIFDLGTVVGGEFTPGIPLRAVLSTDLGRIGYRSVIVDPELTCERQGLFGTELGFSAPLGVAFAQHHLQDYILRGGPRVPDR